MQQNETINITVYFFQNCTYHSKDQTSSLSQISSITHNLHPLCLLQSKEIFYIVIDEMYIIPVY